MLQSAPPPFPTPAIAGAAAAAAALVELGKLMAELCEVIETETALVRAGRVAAAGKLADRKSELARAFMRDVAQVRLLGRAAAPLLDALRRQHEQFGAKLQTNLTVLATARAVSEGILRGVSNELAKRKTLQTYGASGRRQLQAQPPVTPIAVSRSL